MELFLSSQSYNKYQKTKMQIKLRHPNINIKVVKLNRLNSQQISKYPCRFQSFVIPPKSSDVFHENLIRLDGESN